MLNKPSNLEIRNGNLWVISENRFINRRTASTIQLIKFNGKTIASFDTFKDCAKYLGVSIQIIPNRIEKKIKFKFKDKICTLKKVSL